MGREGRNDAVEIARQEKNRWKKRALNAEATLAKLREWAEALALQPDPPADDEMAGQINAAGDILAILDESPTERETP